MSFVDEEAPIFQEEVLRKVDSRLTLSPVELEVLTASPGPSSLAIPLHRDPSLPVLGLGHPGLQRSTPETASDCDSWKSSSMADTVPDPPGIYSGTQTTSEDAVTASADLVAKALAASNLASRKEDDKSNTTSNLPAEPERVDSAHSASDLHLESADARSNTRSPLKLHMPHSTAGAQLQSDTLATSPSLGKHVIPAPEGTSDTLPIVQPTSPVQERDSVGSPTTILPSFRQLTGQLTQLDKLAEAAATQGSAHAAAASHSRNNSMSYSSNTAPSPRIPYHYPASVQTSPVSQYPYGGTARSPMSTMSDMTHAPYGSPTQYPSPAAYFADRRRSSAATDVAHGPPCSVPSLPSASSSGESHGPASSGTEGYSTAHTTPIDAAQISDGTPRPIPILPPPRGMPHSAVVISGGFKCDYQGCNALPFQTQYLLSSHKNVHSQTRPYFCPEKDCPRSEGGKGFKRKNEMIRHGLVHRSPGYVCPFCPDREHRYPRPDNLQRHVRVHHVDRDRYDPALSEVLAQRIEGIGKQRRRRTNPHGNTSS